MPLIRPIAICIFHNNGEILVSQGFDHVKGTYFYRPLGGGIEFGEISAQTIVREIREEIGAEVINLHLIGTLENIFTFQGIPSHQIIQVYDGEFVDPSFYQSPSVVGMESNGDKFEAIWRSIDSFEEAELVPAGLLKLLQTHFCLAP